MKNLKKLLAVIVAICVLATFTVPAFAEEAAAKTDAAICEDLGVLKGTTSGVDAEYLAKGTQRYQAAVITLRLAGKYVEALAFEGTENFDDAAELEWTAGRPALAYLKANPELGWAGSTSGNFFPYAEASAQMIYKVLLESLGYKQGTDFTWDGTIEFAAEKGLVKVADVAKLTNNDVAIAIVEALKAKVKDSEATLAETLVEAGAIDKAAAIEAGLYSAELKATVAATGAKKLTVTFNQAVDSEKAAITVKKGAVAVNVSKKTFAEDKKSVVIELAGKIVKGDYTVSVTGLTDSAITATVTAADETVSKVELGEHAVFVSATAVNVNYKVLNQYGEDVTSATTLQYATNGTGVSFSGGVATVAFGTVKVGDTVTLTLIHVDSAITASKTYVVAEKAGAAEIVIESLYNADGKTLNENSTPGDFKLVVVAKDQYGNKLNDTSLSSDIIASISDISIADVNGGAADTIVTFTTTKIDGVDQVTLPLSGTLKAGTTKITLISKTSGKNGTFDIVVKDKVKTDTIALTAPDLLAVGEDAVFQVDARDTEGNSITKVADLTGTTITATTTAGASIANPAGTFKLNAKTKNIELTVPKANIGGVKGKAILVIKTATNKIFTFTVDVKDAAVPTTFVGFKSSSDVVPNIYVSEVITFQVGDVIVEDQYGRVMSESALAATLGTSAANGGAADKYLLSFLSSDDAVISDGDNAGLALPADDGVLTSDVATVTLTAGATKGSATITATIYKSNGTAYSAVAASSFDYAMRVVNASEITSYEVKDIGTMYDDDATGTYTTDVTVYGVLSNGTKVVVPASKYNIISDADVAKFIISGKTLDANALVAAGKDDITVNLSVFVEGDGATVTIPKTVVVSKAAPKAVELIVDSAGGLTVVADTVTGDAADVTVAKLKALVVAKDQYGKKTGSGSELTAPVLLVTNISATPTLAITALTNGTTSLAFTTGPAAGDTFDITYVYGSLTTTLKVTAE